MLLQQQLMEIQVNDKSTANFILLLNTLLFNNNQFIGNYNNYIIMNTHLRKCRGPGGETRDTLGPFTVLS